MQEDKKIESSPKNNSNSRKKTNNVLFVVIIVIVSIIVLGIISFSLILAFTNVPINRVVNLLPNANPPCKYADTDLCHFIKNWKDVRNVTISSHEKQETGVIFDILLKIQGEDKTQVIITENGKEISNAIEIGDVSYHKDYSDNKWYKYLTSDGDNGPAVFRADYEFYKKSQDSNNGDRYISAGKEQCGNLTCFKYELVDSGGSDRNIFIYFDDQDYLLQKTRIEYSAGDIAEATVDYAAFDIVAPIPIKEGNPFTVIPT